MLMLANWVNTTGEYILGNIVKHHAGELDRRRAGRRPDRGADHRRLLLEVLHLRQRPRACILQLFVVSRIVKYLGIGWAVMILPCISLGAYNVLAFIPTLTFVLMAKVAENSTDYSLNNTVRNMLFLPCTYEEKFSAKQAIDSFFVRMGDVLSAALVFFGTNIMQLERAEVRGRQRGAGALLAGVRVARRQRSTCSARHRHRCRRRRRRPRRCPANGFSRRG